MAKSTNIEIAYQLAVECYAGLGMDVDHALKALAQIPISLHCWQGDDVGGFEIFCRTPGGGLVATGRPTDLKIPVFGNWFFCALAGTFWYFHFFFYQMGESQMGNYKFCSWTLHMASIVIFSTLWGIFFKEWRGAKTLTKSLVVVMLVFLIGSTCTIGWGNKISEDASIAKATSGTAEVTK